jgi:hypothetical protein
MKALRLNAWKSSPVLEDVPTPEPEPRQALVVFESMFGNTERIARAVAVGIERAGWEVRVLEVSDAPGAWIRDQDLLVVGAPTHAFSLSKPNTRADAVRQGAVPGHETIGLREWLAALPPVTDPPPVAVFDTRVSRVRRLPANAGAKAAKILRRRGFRVVGHPVGFLVADIAGPLLEDEADRASLWAEGLVRDAAVHTGELLK